MLIGSLTYYQANMETLMRNRELTETRMMQVSPLRLYEFKVASFFIGRYLLDGNTWDIFSTSYMFLYG